MPDLIITPNRNTLTGIPQIQFVGASGSGIVLQVLQDGSLGFIGSAGGLFGISDALTGSLMSVNNIAGLPIFEVFDTDKVIAGEFGTNALVVSGSGVAFGTDYVPSNRQIFVSGDIEYLGQLFSGGVNTSDLFYPRTNPSGYITSSETGGYATKIELYNTGSVLNSRVISLSGYSAPSNANYVYRTGNQIISGNFTLKSGEYVDALNISANYSVKNTDNRLYCDNTSTITLTFGSAVTNSGQLVKIKNINTGVVIVTGTAGQLFDGTSKITLSTQYTTREFHSNGSNWYVW